MPPAARKQRASFDQQRRQRALQGFFVEPSLAQAGDTEHDATIAALAARIAVLEARLYSTPEPQRSLSPAQIEARRAGGRARASVAWRADDGTFL